MSDTIRGDRTPDPSMADQQDTQSSDPGDAPEVTTAKPAARLAELASGHESNPTEGRETVFQLDKVTISYSGKPAICDVDLSVHRNLVTAFIGPSGCGKTTLLRSLNRMNDLIPGASVEGRISYHGHDLYGSNVDPVELRRRIGMVFQRPNPFPKSIYDNVAYGPRVHGVQRRSELDALVEKSLRGAALWEEVKDRLHESALGMSGGQQQRLCIARAIAVEPEVVLLDEPASALDPIATSAIEDLMHELKRDYTFVIVTHNMQQAARISDRTAFMLSGKLVEAGPTQSIFTKPSERLTEDYITGRFG